MSEPHASELTAAELGRARGRVYGLFAKLSIDGLSLDVLEQLRTLDGWLLPEGPVDLDAIAAEHHACLQLELFPYAGVMLAPEAVAGARADLCRGLFERAGFRPRLDQVSADHLGVAAAFLSFACAAAGEAHEDRRADVAAQLDQLCAEFLDAVVLAVLPSMVTALAHLRVGEFWPRVLVELLEFAAAHRNTLPGARVAVELPQAQALLADARTGLRQIAEYLLVPAHAGVFLTRADLSLLGRARALPRGFGSRLITLENLLRSAVDYDALAPLLADLDALLAERDRELARLADELDLHISVAPWRATIERTRAMLSSIVARYNQHRLGELRSPPVDSLRSPTDASQEL